MGFTLTDLIGCLDLRRTAEDSYQADNYPLSYRRVFGGQLLAQAIGVLHEVGGGKQVKSLSFTFLREGDPEKPVEYRAQILQAGRTFATITVLVTQGERAIGTVTGSLHAPEPGWETSATMPTAPTPEQSVPTELQLFPWETRVVDGVDLNDRGSAAQRYQLWTRTPALRDHPRVVGPEDQWIQQALLSHLSEPSLIGTGLLGIDGVGQADATVRFTSAVTTHSIWFHRDLDLTDWLLIDHAMPVMTGGRGFGRADVWTATGDLVASFAQESLVRPLG